MTSPGPVLASCDEFAPEPLPALWSVDVWFVPEPEDEPVPDGLDELVVEWLPDDGEVELLPEGAGEL